MSTRRWRPAQKLATLALLSSIAAARPPAPRPPETWILARSRHFEVYSDASPNSAPALLADFERMHAFFARQVGAAPDPRRPVRIICFGGRLEYESYRLRSGADAYYLGTESRDYIVMPACAPGDFHLAAHEYAHLLIHASGLGLPRWIAEGISEVASTVQIGDRASSVGGDIPDRSRLLRSERWLPLSDLFARGENAEGSAVFYSQSWALTAMLLLSPEYGPGFRLLVASLASGVAGDEALSSAYNRSPNTVIRDLQAWLARIPPPIPLPGIAGLALPGQPAPVSAFESQAMLADLRFASGDLDRAETMYRSLAAGPGGRPGAASIYAALGLIALRKNDAPAALAAWERAMQLGIADAGTCYRYAVLAEQRGLPPGQVRRALEQAISLRPDFDDARFQLALMLKNAGQSEPVLAQLKAMGAVSPARAFAYWSAMADTLLDLGRREDARAAALQARQAATSDAEREHAAQILYMADTDLAVQLTSGPGGPAFQAIRVPHDQLPRNPFIESGDRIQRVEATLKRIECAESEIRIAVSGQSGDLTLSVPDPSRVEIRNTPGVSFEFTCGPQTPRKVFVEYTTTNILRGLEMR
ncbi:MAG TPA: tetratricopeptide repeat protein [Candidatus Acidoferrales bacterium]|jgi:tetratricopeptide (TPR) repeat protein|nr:tetratricopeptide repeat protein [Candidatus Acidoferrales bacterium]